MTSLKKLQRAAQHRAAQTNRPFELQIRVAGLADILSEPGPNEARFHRLLDLSTRVEEAQAAWRRVDEEIRIEFQVERPAILARIAEIGSQIGAMEAQIVTWQKCRDRPISVINQDVRHTRALIAEARAEAARLDKVELSLWELDLADLQRERALRLATLTGACDALEHEIGLELDSPPTWRAPATAKKAVKA